MRAKIIKLGISALYPVGIFYLIELYEHNPFTEVYGIAQFFNIVWYELLVWSLFFVSGSTRIALRVVCAGAMVFGLVNHYVMEFRSTPFVPWDLLSVRTAASVAGNYNFAPSGRVILVTVVLVALLIVAPKVKWDYKGRRTLLCRGAAFVAGVTMLMLFAGRLQDRRFQVSNGLYPHLFTPAHMTKVNGMTVTFVMNMAYMDLEKPTGYDAAWCQDFLEDQQQELDQEQGQQSQQQSQQQEPGQQASTPNIVVIMDEAFSDLGVLGELNASKDCMPFVHSLMQGADNTVTGDLYVSVCGGNTANTEYEFLTGNTMAFLPAGSVPYQQYIHGDIPSLARQLGDMGYSTYAMHPYYSTGWNRNTVYPRMDFDHMLFRNDMEGLTYVRDYVSDASDFTNIKQILQEKGDAPAFIFNVTMQNHGSYGEASENFTPDITVEGVDSFALSQYLSLLRLTDQELAQLLEWLASYEEDTLVVFFGDHQPSDAVARAIAGDKSQSDKDYYYAKGAEERAQEENLRYVVPYVIWANYDIAEATSYDMSVNYLAANALRIAGLPTNAYQDYLLNLQERYPIVSSVYTKKAPEATKEELLTYEKLQYYQMFDWRKQ